MTSEDGKDLLESLRGGGFGKLLEQAQGLQAKMAEVQQRLGRIEVEGEAGGGMVKVTANGRAEVVRVEIEESLFRPEDRTMVQDLIVVATNNAMQKAKALASSEMSALTGGLGLGNLPGFGP